MKYHIKQHPEEPIVMLGDYNTSPKKMGDWIRMWGLPMQIVPIPEGSVTFKIRKTVVEYIICYPGFGLRWNTATVSGDFSDHN